MNYPELSRTPIREIIFSVSYDKIIDAQCFNKFINLDEIRAKFRDIKPSIDQKFELNDHGKLLIQSQSNGFHLNNESEVIQIRKGSFSYHFLNKYLKFSQLLSNFAFYWSNFDTVTDDTLQITEYSVRYINYIKVDEHDQFSRLIQLYPKYSSDRQIEGFRNSVNFSYSDQLDYGVAITTAKSKNGILLDITVKGDSIDEHSDFESLFGPLRELKNRAFFDSITAKTLLKYL